jgi:hypothetical protein
MVAALSAFIRIWGGSAGRPSEIVADSRYRAGRQGADPGETHTEPGVFMVNGAGLLTNTMAE